MPILAKWSRAAAAWLSAALVAFFAPACAAQPLEVRVGVGFGLAFLPTYLMDELKLVEKHARAAGLDVTTTYRRFSGSGPMQDAILSGNIDMGPLGIPTLLIASEKARGTPLQPFAIAGVTTLPLVLLSNRIGVAKLADLTTDDRVAMPSPVSPQMYLLQMAAEQAFGPGQHDRFRHQVVSLPHPDAVSALASGSKEVTAYFSSPPFTALAMKTSSVHRVLDSDDVFAGKSSFVVMEATRGFIEATRNCPMSSSRQSRRRPISSRAIRSRPARSICSASLPSVSMPRRSPQS